MRILYYFRSWRKWLANSQTAADCYRENWKTKTQNLGGRKGVRNSHTVLNNRSIFSLVYMYALPSIHTALINIYIPSLPSVFRGRNQKKSGQKMNGIDRQMTVDTRSSFFLIPCIPFISIYVFWCLLTVVSISFIPPFLYQQWGSEPPLSRCHPYRYKPVVGS